MSASFDNPCARIPTYRAGPFWSEFGDGLSLRGVYAPPAAYAAYPNTLAPVVCAGEGASLFAGG